jgi:two-component system chemotaxis response regulator CheB
VIRVLVVDDSVAIRSLVSSLLGEDPEIEVAGVAPNGRLGLAKYQQLRPDVVTLDVEMPEMDGLETLKAIRKFHPSAAVIMFSSLTHRGAVTTFDSLAAGAVDYVAKPEAANPNDLIAALKSDLITKVKLHGRPKGSNVLPIPVRASADPRPRPPQPQRILPVDVIAIASSTGGPNALNVVIGALPKGLSVPVVIVQHMPQVFTQMLAERLNSYSSIEVREGREGDVVRAGCVYIAPGGFHMETVRVGRNVVLQTHEGPPENSCRPAADVLFRSVVNAYSGKVLGVVLTGMGQDGYRGSEAIRACGGQVIAQDEASSVVWGMPRMVAEAGLAHAILPLDQIASEILKKVANRG